MVSDMKKVFVFLLSILIIFCLGACGKAPSQDPETSESACLQESALPDQPQELVALDISSLGDIFITALDSSERYTVLYYTDFIAAGDGEGEDAPAPPREHIAVFRLPENELVKKIDFPNEDRYWYTVDANADSFDLVNQQIGEIITYDYSLENSEKSAYEYIDLWEKWKEISTVNTAWFDCKEQYALSTSYGQAQALVFYDQPDVYYMLENNIYYEYRKCFGHTILALDNSANRTDRPESNVRVMDFDNMTEINSVTIPNELSYNNIQWTNLNQSAVTLATCMDDGKTDKVYVWRYTVDPKDTAFENIGCERFAAGDIDGKITALCAEIRQEYGVTLECAPDYQFIRDSFDYSNDYPKILFYQKALELEYDLSLLPKEIYRDLLCGDTEDMSPFDDFRIYLVGTSPDAGIDAYAGNIGCDETDGKLIVYIAYACTGLNQKTFFHELMHTFEYRIWYYESEFDTKWEKLNPDGFAYTEEYGACYYDESHTDWQDYFARDYGMRSDLEDRATCFEELCDGVLSDSMWWRDKPPLAAKQQYLIEVLRKSFPSLADWSVFAQAFPMD